MTVNPQRRCAAHSTVGAPVKPGNVMRAVKLGQRRRADGRSAQRLARFAWRIRPTQRNAHEVMWVWRKFAAAPHAEHESLFRRALRGPEPPRAPMVCELRHEWR
jgi:hypothetical protein